MREHSLHRINYAVRPNKNVQRKLIIETLRNLKPEFGIRNYVYIGLGGMWFIDFILMHKHLDIYNMVSIEWEENAKRAEFNKPYACISVEAGETTLVLPELKLAENRSIIWLDYNDSIDGPVIDDTRIICNNAMSGSIVLVTLNSNFSRLKKIRDPNNKLLNNEDTFRYYTKDLAPTKIPNKIFQKQNYPKFLASFIFNIVGHFIFKSGRGERFYPLFNYYYNDGSPMITVGGMIGNESDKTRLEKFREKNTLNYLGDEKNQRKITVPQLTPKEKIELDRLLPSNNPLKLNKLKKKGIELKDEELKSYWQFYRYYPIFGEILL